MNKIIAIDGTAASGKGTLARKLASQLNLKYLDTGSLYRAVALKTLETGQAPEEIAKNLKEDDLTSPKLRNEKVGNMASEISAISEVRENLLQWQRDFAKQGAVLDGRDIGTVVCPNAYAKFYIHASVAVRAKRRFDELSEKNIDITLEDIQKDLEERDNRDMQRTICPLLPADDAIRIDTSNMDADDVFEFALSYIEEKR